MRGVDSWALAKRAGGAARNQRTRTATLLGGASTYPVTGISKIVRRDRLGIIGQRKDLAKIRAISAPGDLVRSLHSLYAISREERNPIFRSRLFSSITEFRPVLPRRDPPSALAFPQEI